MNLKDKLQIPLQKVQQKLINEHSKFDHGNLAFRLIPGILVDSELYEEAFEILFQSASRFEPAQLEKSPQNEAYQDILFYAHALDYLHRHAPHFNYRQLWQNVANYLDWLSEKNDPLSSLTSSGLYLIQRVKSAQGPIELQSLMIFVLERIIPLTRHHDFLGDWLHKARSTFAQNYVIPQLPYLANSKSDQEFHLCQLWAFSTEIGTISSAKEKEILNYLKTQIYNPNIMDPLKDELSYLGQFTDFLIQIEREKNAKEYLDAWINRHLSTADFNQLKDEEISSLNHLVFLFSY